MKPVARPPRQGGFILVAVLALLVVLAMLAAAAAESSQRAVADMHAQQQRFQAELDQMSTRETLLFMLATQRRTLAGLSVHYVTPSSALLDDEDISMLPQGGEVRLDGRPYAGLGETEFALQDDGGLLSVNWGSELLRTGWLRSLGAAPEAWQRLEDIRLDYQDADSLRRLDGAEADEYKKLGMQPPANRSLSTPLELRRLPGWRELLQPLDDEQLLAQISVVRSTMVNLNSAPASLLALLPGMNAAEAARLIALRQALPLASLHQAQTTFPLVDAEEGFYNLFANTSGNLILWDRRYGTKRLAHWTLTSLGDTDRPWRIDYEVTLPRGNHPDQPVAGKPETPLLSAPDPAGQ